MTFRNGEVAYEETELHCERVACVSAAIAKQLEQDGRDMGGLFGIEKIYCAALYHDEGKRHIPQEILNKPGRVTSQEFDIMRTHTTKGAEVLKDRGYDDIFVEAALCHHERWDGTGYPEGRSGEDIPLIARIVAVADVYDALSAKRCYKDPMPHEQVVMNIVAGKGKHFDPKVVDAFIAAQDLIRSEVQILDAHYDHIKEEPAAEPVLDIFSRQEIISELEARFGTLHYEDGMFLCNKDGYPIAIADERGFISEVEENAYLSYAEGFKQRDSAESEL